jgi:hypothetical protein
MKAYSLLSVTVLSILFASTLHSQSGTIKQVKITKFRLQSSHLINQSGEELSSGTYRPDVWWFPVNVPSTVLTGLVANKVYPDPYQGMNNMLIPDASDEFNKKYDLEKYSQLPGQPNPWKKPYWYITEFNVPSTDKGRHFELIFKGINYRAGVWLNGKLIADSTQMAGMFAEYRLDVSGLIKAGAMNNLAVKIYPLDYPGLPANEQLKAFDDFYANGGPTGDIGKNVTMLCSVGWDWMPPVRDRNIGIWQPVYLRTSGQVTIVQPQLITDLPSLPDTGTARITVKFKIRNSSDNDDNGQAVITITPETFSGKPVKFTRNIIAGKNRITSAIFSGDDTKELIISHPHLWWPNGYGKPELYRIKIQYFSANGLSDEQSFLFGIRNVSTNAVDVNGTWRRDFYVNGRRIQLTGGAWVPDMMLNRDSLRYDYEFRLCRNSNINLVRIWGGGVTPSDYFFDAADKYGLLVWSDFWITGDTQGEFKGSPDWPLEGDVFKKNVASTIYRIRNHPSLLVWTGGNEGHARKELYYAMRDSIIKLDGTRPYIPSSSGFAKLPEGWDGAWPDGKPTGVYSGGPYTWQDPKVYYQKADAGGDWVFKDETGIPSQPPYSSLSKNIPNLVWDKTLPFPFNNSWGYHDACTGNGRYDNYYKEMVKRYGEPGTMKEFSDKMQLMNATGYQGIFEAAGHKLNEIGGVMLWKLNAAFPSVVWQVYDWFLVPNAGYYLMQNACEPVHIQLNTKDLNIEYINRTYKPIKSLTAHIEIFDTDSKSLFTTTEKVDLAAPEAKEGLSVADVINKNQGISFVVLNLKSADGKVISHNVYWLSPKNDFTNLKSLAVSSLTAKVGNAASVTNERRWSLQLTNNSGKIAFFINPRLMSGDEEIAPSFWSANYFTLAPGESLDLTVGCPPEAMGSGALNIRIEGWNVETILFPIK